MRKLQDRIDIVRWRTRDLPAWFREHRAGAVGIGLGAVALVIVIVAVVPSRHHGFVTRVPMIDVATARVYWVSVESRAVCVPAPNPDTGDRTLVGVDRDPDGSWRVLPQDIPLIATLGVRASPRIDLVTGIVRPSRGGGG